MRRTKLLVAILMLVTAASADWTAPLGSGAVAPNMMPAKYSLSPFAAPNCLEDFIVYGLNVPAAVGRQANLVAFNQLYKDGEGGLCGSGSPEVLWAYAIATLPGGTIRTSPVLSLDGKKIAFVESSPTGAAFHVLTWSSGPGNGKSATAAALPGQGNNASLVTVRYSPAATNSLSSPYVDYSNDVAYVGAESGKLYKITGVFRGKPALAGAPWPVAVSTGARLSAPSLDPVSGRIFVGDSRGRLFAVDGESARVVSSLSVGRGPALGAAITDAPLLDVMAGMVFAFSSNDGTSAVVVQTNTDLHELARVHIGRGMVRFGATAEPLPRTRLPRPSAGVHIHSGILDDSYYASPDSGHMWVCGTAANHTGAVLYRVGFDLGVLDPLQVAAFPLTRTSLTECSQITAGYDGDAENDLLTFTTNRGFGRMGERGGLVQVRVRAGMPAFNVREIPVGNTSAVTLDSGDGGQSAATYFSTPSPSTAVRMLVTD